MISKINDIQQAYQVKNLNKISSQIIQSRKNKNFSLIISIANACDIPEEASTHRLFGKIIQLYHPDKSESILNDIKQLIELNNERDLEKYSHIFKTQQLLEKRIETIDNEINIEFEESWEESSNNDFYYFEEDDKNDQEDFVYEEIEIDSYNFYEAVQVRELGDLSKSYPTYYLEDIEEFELASFKINSLEGIQYCKHTKIFDLSDNMISDLSELFELNQIVELYLAHNEISIIDSLSNLTELKKLDVSFNLIDDLSPLLELNNLEYLNIIGNPINTASITEFKNKGVQVIY